MVKKLSEIDRTAVFAWGPGQQTPYIAAGTAAGALDDSFSNASELEIFKLDFANSKKLESVGKISSSSRFNKLVWGNVSSSNPYGVIAGGLENGHLALWDSAKIIDGKSEEEAQIISNSIHTGQIRGLDFNKFQTNLLASAGSNNEVYIWDLTNPNTPYKPGPESQKSDDITNVGWNGQVQHILATTSATGNTVVWDLRNRKEVMTLSAPNNGGLNTGRKSLSSVAWHPDVATQLVTASEDDFNPIVTLWDLRHAHSPERLLAGHTKGVLNLSWCRQDSDLLMSCGRDCKTLIWNPNSGELLGELAQDSNWTFQTEWCPRNPDLLATASFDGKIDVYSLQNSGSDDSFPEPAAEAVHDDPFSAAMNAAAAAASASSAFALRNPPKWLRRPVGASFGFGGKLVIFNNKAGQAAAQAAATLPPGQAPVIQKVSRGISVRSIVTDKDVVERAVQLETALEHQSVEQLVEERVQQAKDNDEKESWEVIKTLLTEDAREQLMNYLGFQKSEVIAAVAKATAANKALESTEETVEDNTEISATSEISTAEETNIAETVTEEQEVLTEDVKPEESASDNSASGLFGGEASDDFFAQATIQTEVISEVTNDVTVSADPIDAVVAAIKREPLQLYAEGSSETDRLITRAVILGDFESAVSLCLAAEKFSDALLFAICGGSDLLVRTQKAYFKHQSKSVSYLRLLENIVDEDLTSVVTTVALEEWTSAIVVLCTFAKAEDFRPLCETLGARLEEAWSASEPEKAKEFRRHATLCYLVAGNIENVARIWIAEQEEEAAASETQAAKSITLQKLIEKITIFRKVIAFEDAALYETDESKLSYEYPLSPLYNKYCEYAQLLAAQGNLTTALTYLSLTPAVYRKAAFDEFSVIRDRVYQACPSTVASQFAQPSVPFEIKTVDAFVAEPQIQNVASSGYGQSQLYQSGYQSYQSYQTTTTTAQQTSYATTRSPVATNTYSSLTSSYSPSANAYGSTAAAQTYSPRVSNDYTPTAPVATNYAPVAPSTSYTPSAPTTSYTPSAPTTSYTPTAPATTNYAPTTASGPPTNLYQPQNSTPAPTTAYGYNQPSDTTNTYNSNYNATSSYNQDQYNNNSYNTGRPTIPAPPPIAGIAPVARSQVNTPPKKAEGAWNDPPMAIAAAKKIKSPKVATAPTARIVSPFPNQPSPSAFVSPPQQQSYQQNTPNLPPPPMNRVAPPPMGPPRNMAPPPPQQRAMPPPQQVGAPPAGPPMGMMPPPRSNPIPPPPMNATPPTPLAKRVPPPPQQGGYYQQQQRMN